MAALREPAQAVVPGGTARFALDVRNTGATIDRLAIEVIGDPAAWAEVDSPSLQLGPGASATVTVRIRPPLDPAPPPGEVDFGVRVRSAGHPEAAAVELGVLEIRPATGIAAGGTSAAPAAAPGRPASAAGPVAPAAERTEDVPATVPAGVRVRDPRAVGAITLVALVIVAAVAVGGSILTRGSAPAAVGSAAPAASPSPVSSPGSPVSSPVSPVSSPVSPVPPASTRTLQPVVPSPDPDAVVAWWQDAFDAAAERGIALGAAVAEGTTDENLPYAEFANGAVVQRVNDAYWLSDAIWQAWRVLGGGPGPAAILGYPASPPLGPDLAQRRQLFDDGAIFWTPAAGVHVVHGPVWAWWSQLVGTGGGDVADPGGSGLVDSLGGPTSDVRSDANGSWIELERGAIGVTGDGAQWACSSVDPATGFPACADLRGADPRLPAPPQPTSAP